MASSWAHHEWDHGSSRKDLSIFWLSQHLEAVNLIIQDDPANEIDVILVRTNICKLKTTLEANVYLRSPEANADRM